MFKKCFYRRNGFCFFFLFVPYVALVFKVQEYPDRVRRHRQDGLGTVVPRRQRAERRTTLSGLFIVKNNIN